MRTKGMHAVSSEVAEMLGNRTILAIVDDERAEVHGDHLDHVLPEGREGLIFARFCDASECPRATADEQRALDRLIWMTD